MKKPLAWANGFFVFAQRSVKWSKKRGK